MFVPWCTMQCRRGQRREGWTEPQVSVHKAKKTFGFTDEDNIGKVAFPAVQAAPSFSSVFPHMFGTDKRVGCLIPCAIDQVRPAAVRMGREYHAGVHLVIGRLYASAAEAIDAQPWCSAAHKFTGVQDPYFRITRDVAPSLGFKKPALIESIFFPALQGDEGKMSASVANSAIFVSDTAKQIKDKINKCAASPRALRPACALRRPCCCVHRSEPCSHWARALQHRSCMHAQQQHMTRCNRLWEHRYAVSGGRQTEKEHRELGADLSVDVPYKWLEFFLDDQKEFDRIGSEYGSGRMLTGEVKQILIALLQTLVGRHQRARAMVSEEVVHAFMRPRKMTNLWG